MGVVYGVGMACGAMSVACFDMGVACDLGVALQDGLNLVT